MRGWLGALLEVVEGLVFWIRRGILGGVTGGKSSLDKSASLPFSTAIEDDTTSDKAYGPGHSRLDQHYTTELLLHPALPAERSSGKVVECILALKPSGYKQERRIIHIDQPTTAT
jgi:hypothetical protein